MSTAESKRGVARYSIRGAVAFASGLLAVATGWIALDLSWPISSAGTSDYGFSAHYVIPSPFPDTPGRCSFGSPYGPRSMSWDGGPHAGFDAHDPGRLALQSMAWFEESPDAQTWLAHESVALELDYPSENRLVNVRRARAAEHGWQEQLRAWFERIPPSSDSEWQSWGDDYSWSVTFGEHGEVQGDARSAEEGVAALKAWIPEQGGSPFFALPTFELGQMVRADARTMNCYRVDTSRPEEIDGLLHRLREQRDEWEND